MNQDSDITTKKSFAINFCIFHNFYFSLSLQATSSRLKSHDSLDEEDIDDDEENPMLIGTGNNFEKASK